MKAMYSDSGEICLVASRKDLKYFSQFVISFPEKDKPLKLTLEPVENYQEYNGACSDLIVSLAKSNRIEVRNETLHIEGHKNFLENFASNLPFDAETVPYHVHYDHIGFPQYLSEGSPELVIEANE